MVHDKNKLSKIKFLYCAVIWWWRIHGQKLIHCIIQNIKINDTVVLKKEKNRISMVKKKKKKTEWGNACKTKCLKNNQVQKMKKNKYCHCFGSMNFGDSYLLVFNRKKCLRIV